MRKGLTLLFLLLCLPLSAQDFFDIPFERPELKTFEDTMRFIRTPRRIFTDVPVSDQYPYWSTKSELIAFQNEMATLKKDSRDTLLISHPFETYWPNTRILQRFKPTNGDYNLVIVSIAFPEGEYNLLSQNLITFRNEKEYSYSCRNIGGLNTKDGNLYSSSQWYLNEKMELIVYELDRNPPYDDDADTLNIERIDWYYLIMPDGKIKPTRAVFYKERQLPRSYLNRLEYNIWEDMDFEIIKMERYPDPVEKKK